MLPSTVAASQQWLLNSRNMADLNWDMLQKYTLDIELIYKGNEQYLINNISHMLKQ